MMKKIDSFFITIVTIVLTLSGVYFYAYKKLNYFEDNPKLKAKLERKLELISLQKKLEGVSEATHAARRNIASISNEPHENEFLEENIVDFEDPAKKYYLEAKTKCYELNKEAECVRIIDSAVTHFPESSWTAESLVILSEFYYRTKRTAYMKDIVKILKDDFKHDKAIQEKVALIERHLR